MRADGRPRFRFWQRWLRRVFLGMELTRCIRCMVLEVVGPDLLCDSCLGDPDVREAYIDDAEP